jgi:hypothetical protein
VSGYSSIQTRPRPFLVAAAVRAPVVLGAMPIYAQIPKGAPFRLDYILANYPVTVAGGAQTSPTLSFMLYDSEGRALTQKPVNFRDITTPSGGPKVWGVQRWGILYPPLSVLTMDIIGQATGPIPATFSVTFMGVKDWEVR